MNVLERFQQISTFVFDVDGILTDGSVLLFENGLQARKMNIKDGLALQMAIQHDYRVVIISGGTSDPVRDRFEFLGLSEIHLGISDKLNFLRELLADGAENWNEILYMGDDLPDLALLEKVGVSCCPNDAVMEVRSKCHYISPFNGGQGCVRDVIEKVLKLNGHWTYDPQISSR